MPDSTKACSGTGATEVPPWQCRARAQRATATAVNGNVLEFDEGHVERRTRSDELVWRAALPELANCRGGAIAVGYRDEIRVACNDRLEALRGGGEREWHLSFPGHSVTQPLIDGSGVAFVGAGNRFLAIDARGSVAWSVSVPGDRVLFDPALDAEGAFLFVAGTNETEIVTSHYVFYLPQSDALLYRVAPTGAVLETYPVKQRPGGKWPAYTPIGADVGHRIPPHRER